MLDKGPAPLDAPTLLQILQKPLACRKGVSLQPRDKVREALNFTETSKVQSYIIEHSGLSKFRAIRAVLLPLFKKTLGEVYYLDIIVPRFDAKVRRRIENAQKRPDMFKMLSQRRKTSESESLDQRSFLFLKDPKYADQEDQNFESHHLFYRSLKDFKEDVALKLFSDAKYNRALIATGTEIQYFWELKENQNLFFLCCEPPTAEIKAQGQSNAFFYDSQKDVIGMKAIIEWGKAAKVDVHNHQRIYFEMLFTYFGESRTVLRPFSLQTPQALRKTHVFTLDSIKASKRVFKKQVRSGVSFQTGGPLELQNQVLDTEMGSSSPSIPETLKLTNKIKPFLKLKEIERKRLHKRNTMVARKSTVLLTGKLEQQPKKRDGSLPSQNVSKNLSIPGSQNTSIQQPVGVTQLGGTQATMTTRIGSLPKISSSKVVFGEGGSQNKSSGMLFTPLKRDLRYNLEDSIQYFSKCGDSFQRRAKKQLEGEPVLGSIRVYPRIKDSGSVLDLSSWKPTPLDPPKPSKSQRLPGMKKQKKVGSRSTASLLAEQYRISPFSETREDVHFFYRPIPTLKSSLLLKLQPSIRRICYELHYDVDGVEKCLRQFFLLSLVDKEPINANYDIFPRLIRCKVATKKYFDFLAQSDALTKELGYHAVYSFFQNLKNRSLELFKLALVAIDAPLLDFNGFMKIRYYFVQKRASPNQIIDFVAYILSALLDGYGNFDMLKETKSGKSLALEELAIPDKMTRWLESVRTDDFYNNEGHLCSEGFKRKCRFGELDALSFLQALY